MRMVFFSNKTGALWNAFVPRTAPHRTLVPPCQKPGHCISNTSGTAQQNSRVRVCKRVRCGIVFSIVETILLGGPGCGAQQPRCTTRHPAGESPQPRMRALLAEPGAMRCGAVRVGFFFLVLALWMQGVGRRGIVYIERVGRVLVEGLVACLDVGE